MTDLWEECFYPLHPSETSRLLCHAVQRLVIWRVLEDDVTRNNLYIGAHLPNTLNFHYPGDTQYLSPLSATLYTRNDYNSRRGGPRIRICCFGNFGGGENFWSATPEMTAWPQRLLYLRVPKSGHNKIYKSAKTVRSSRSYSILYHGACLSWWLMSARI